MKKLVSTLLVSSMALSLVGCGAPKAPAAATAAPAATQAAAEATTAAPAGPEAITLKVWAPQVDQVDENSWINVMLPKFEEAHPITFVDAMAWHIDA